MTVPLVLRDVLLICGDTRRYLGDGPRTPLKQK